MKPRVIPIIFLVLVIVGLGMLSTIIPAIATPNDRIFTGMNGYSSDYTQYVSYVKEGMYGRYTMLFRSFPLTQPQTPIHFLYIVTGIIAGFFRMSAPLAFHMLRIVLGSLYVLLTYKLFRRAFNESVAFLGTILAFVSSPLGWPVFINGKWDIAKLSFFNFSIIHPERVTDRPHYLFGAVMFLLILLLLAREGERNKKRGIFFVLSFLAAMVHTSVGILLFAMSTIVFASKLYRHSIKKEDIHLVGFFSLFILMGSLGALGITYLFVREYTLVPEIWLDSYIYSGSITFESLVKDLISFGPTLWLGITGLIWALISKKEKKDLNALMLLWLAVQMGLFLFGYRLFHADRVRFLQSLYFLPMAYGTILFFQILSRHFARRTLPIGIALMILISLPVYTQDLVRSLFSLTDFQIFTPFVFPTKAQAQAYRFLDTQEPKETIVLAAYEAANNLLIYSHNMVLGNNQGWAHAQGEQMLATRDAFFAGTMDASQARKYLSDHHVAYVYYGYQERSFGGDIEKYEFLSPEFSNTEVIIYRVQ